MAREAKIRVEAIKPQRCVIKPSQHGKFRTHGIGAEGGNRQGTLHQGGAGQPILMRQGLRHAKAARIAEAFQLQQQQMRRWVRKLQHSRRRRMPALPCGAFSRGQPRMQRKTGQRPKACGVPYGVALQRSVAQQKKWAQGDAKQNGAQQQHKCMLRQRKIKPWFQHHNSNRKRHAGANTQRQQWPWHKGQIKARMRKYLP